MTSKTAEKKGAKQAAKTDGSKSVPKTKATPDKATTTTKATPTPQADGGPASKKPTEPTAPATPRDDAQTQPDDTQEVVVFAFRLTRAERNLIHEAAGSAKASKFVRGIALAAARGDAKAVKETMETIQKTG